MANENTLRQEITDLTNRISQLEQFASTVNQRYSVGNWSDNYDLTSRRDLSFQVTVMQAIQPFVTVASIGNNRNTSTPILNTSGGPNGGSLLGFAITLRVNVPGDNNQGQLQVVTDGVTSLFTILDANNTSLRNDATFLCTKNFSSTQISFEFANLLFTQNLQINWLWNAGGTSVSNANSVDVYVKWSASYS